MKQFDPFAVRETYLIGGELPMLRPADVSAWLGIDGATLADWRQSGDGPPYYNFDGFIRYKADEVEAWLKQKRDECP